MFFPENTDRRELVGTYYMKHLNEQLYARKIICRGVFDKANSRLVHIIERLEAHGDA